MTFQPQVVSSVIENKLYIIYEILDMIKNKKKGKRKDKLWNSLVFHKTKNNLGTENEEKD